MFAKVKPQRRAIKRTGEIKTLPPPTGGVNDRDSLIAMPPTDALRLENVICRPYGVQVRNGYSEFARINIASPPAGKVHSLLPFTPNADPTLLAGYETFNPYRIPFTHNDIRRKSGARTTPGAKLFAGSTDKLYNITAGGVGPFTAETGPQGTYWTATHFTTLGGTFMPVCPIEGGYWYYNGTTWAHVVAGNGTDANTISGVDPAKFNFVMAWKGRLWFIEKNSTRAWYLPPGQLFGVATAYNFGTQFRKGGVLQAMASWTQDAGVGIDDHLVVVGSEGDLSIYKGTDPNSVDTFGLVGVWYVGSTPIGNRILDPYGGDLHILSNAGLTILSKLLALGDTEDDQVRRTDKINNSLSKLIQSAQGSHGWALKWLPEQNLVAILGPFAPLQRYTMVVQDVNTKGWSVLYDHPCESMAEFNGVTYAGTMDGRVVIAFDAVLDDALLDNPNGFLIRAAIVPAYNDLGKPGLEKRLLQIRLSLLGSRPPQINLTALVDYFLKQETFTPSLPRIIESRWDEALWGIGRWSGGYRPLTSWLGVAGSGFAVTPQIEMQAYGGLIFTQYDWLYEAGGPL